MRNKLIKLVVLSCVLGLCSCDNDSSGSAIDTADCQEGTAKCDGNILSVCSSDGKWSEAQRCGGETPKCDADKITCVPDLCTPNAAKCDGNILSVCGSDGKWSEAQRCGGETPKCDADKITCVPALCTPNAAKCDGNILSVCGSDGKWSEPLPCEGETPKCDEDKKTCVADPCTPDTAKCEGNVLSICNSDGNWDEPLPCEGETPKCDEDKKTCVPDPCTPNTAKCEDNILFICGSNGNWGEIQTCGGNKPKCDAEKKECVPEPCTPDSAKCEGNILSICDSDGNWGEPLPCEGETPKCDEDKKTCVPDPCTPNTAKCEDNVLSVCDSDGNWGKPETCEGNTPICNTEKKACVACLPGEAKCDNNALIICSDDNQWGKPQKCEGETPKCDAEKKACMACTPGEAKCDDNALSVCSDDGKWGKPQTCKDDKPYCNADLKACLVCNPGVPLCTGNGKSAGMRECTTEGTIGNLIGENCPFGCAKDQTACNECDQNSLKCSDDKKSIVSCVDGKWDTNKTKPCDNGLACDSTNPDKPECKCEPYSMVCAYDERAKGIYYCTSEGKLPPSNNQEGLVTYCDCSAEGCPCETENSRSCKLRGLSICKNGFWTPEKTVFCNKSQSCSENAGGVCIPWDLCSQDEVICNGDVLMTCVDGFFQQVEDCGANGYCITSISGGVRSAKCVENPTDTQTCHTGDPWIFSTEGKTKHTTCSDSERCVLTEEPTQLPEVTNIVAKCEKTVCLDHKFACDESEALSVCRNNQYKHVANCKDYGMKCDAKEGKCVLPE